MPLDPDMIRELVDAFLSDHGEVHVGQEQRFAAAGGPLHHDVDGGARECRAHPVGKRAAVDCSGVVDRSGVVDNLGVVFGSR